MRNFGNPLVAVALLCAATSLHGDALYDAFRAPPRDVRPWCYWYWVNGNVDEETATADLEAMKKAGFGGILLLDPRGYDKVVWKPEPKMPFGGDEWRRLVVYSVKECARLGLEFTMNLSDCGGSLKGPWLTGEDGPKRLVVGVDAGDPPSDFKYYHDIATFSVRVAPGTRVKSGWRNAGGVVNRWEKDARVADVPALDWRCGAPEGDGEWHTLRFGYCAIPKREHDVDVIDAAAALRGRAISRMPSAPAPATTCCPTCPSSRASRARGCAPACSSTTAACATTSSATASTARCAVSPTRAA